MDIIDKNGSIPFRQIKKTLTAAKKNKNDEFYTQLTDIENELKHYKHHFKNKVVLCNCDDPEWSNFWIFFDKQFEEYGLKKLIGTHYDENGKPSYKIKTTKGYPERPKTKNLQGDGDFRSEECIELLKEADIVVTNPPFSLFREYVLQLIEYKIFFLIIGNQNAIGYKEIFPLFKSNSIWLGIKNGDMSFTVPSHYEEKLVRFWIDENGQKWRSLGNICWFTNLEHKKRNEEIILYKNFDKDYYLKYDNYDAINVDKTKDIPCDYEGEMGVPITFLDKWNPKQFEIVTLGTVGTCEFTSNNRNNNV